MLLICSIIVRDAKKREEPNRLRWSLNHEAWPNLCCELTIQSFLGFLCCLSLVTSDYYTDEFDDYVPFIGLRRDDFDWKLMKALVQNEGSNLIVSSFSVKVILMMLAEMSGINSKTRKELFTALDNIKTISEGRSLYKKYIASVHVSHNSQIY